MEPIRRQRLAEVLREELEEIINYELQDPRIGDVVVSEVLFPGGSKHARVRILVPPGSQPQRTIAALRHARGYIRYLLATRLSLHHIPELEFEPAVSEQVAAHMKALLRRIRKGRPRDQQEPSSVSESAEDPDELL